MTSPVASLYETDLYAWAMQNTASSPTQLVVIIGQPKALAVKNIRSTRRLA